MKKRTPTTETARRVAAIVHRKDSTPWSEREIRVYKQLYKDGAFNERDICVVERFQFFSRNERKRGRAAFHRRGLLQLLNHWGEEVDHGTDHDELHPLKVPLRKIIPLPSSGKPFIPSTDPEDIAAIERFEAERLRRNPSAFQTVKKEMQS